MSDTSDLYIGMPIYLDDCDCGCCDDPENHPESSDCMYGQPFENWPVAMAYVPFQPWEEVYTEEKGLQAGTIFPSLDLPFLGGKQR